MTLTCARRACHAYPVGPRLPAGGRRGGVGSMTFSTTWLPALLLAGGPAALPGKEIPYVRVFVG